jgi:hypothetical protein
MSRSSTTPPLCLPSLQSNFRLRRAKRTFFPLRGLQSPRQLRGKPAAGAGCARSRRELPWGGGRRLVFQAATRQEGSAGLDHTVRPGVPCEARHGGLPQLCRGLCSPRNGSTQGISVSSNSVETRRQAPHPLQPHPRPNPTSLRTARQRHGPKCRTSPIPFCAFCAFCGFSPERTPPHAVQSCLVSSEKERVHARRARGC